MEKNLPLKIQLLRPDAVIPTRKGDDVGLDLYACTIEKNEAGLLKVSCGIAIEMPRGFWAKIESRSSMAARGFAIQGGIIDNGYRGPIICLLSYSGSDDPLTKISHGDKVAQLVIHKQEDFDVEVVSHLSSTERGEKGFGSTGR